MTDFEVKQLAYNNFVRQK